MQIDDYFLKVWNATEILFYTQFGENSLRNTKLPETWQNIFLLISNFHKNLLEMCRPR